MKEKTKFIIKMDLILFGVWLMLGILGLLVSYNINGFIFCIMTGIFFVVIFTLPTLIILPEDFGMVKKEATK